MTKKKKEPSQYGPTDARPCKACGAPVLWVTWERSMKHMPVDKEPVAEGEVVLNFSKATNRLMAVKFWEKHHAERRRFRCHWETCPESNGKGKKPSIFPQSQALKDVQDTLTKTVGFTREEIGLDDPDVAQDEPGVDYGDKR